jgi:hypothetical protein
MKRRCGLPADYGLVATLGFDLARQGHGPNFGGCDCWHIDGKRRIIIRDHPGDVFLRARGHEAAQQSSNV